MNLSQIDTAQRACVRQLGATDVVDQGEALQRPDIALLPDLAGCLEVFGRASGRFPVAISEVCIDDL